MKRDAQLLHKLNLAMPGTDDYIKIMNELFYNQIGEGSIVAPAPIQAPFLITTGLQSKTSLS